MRNQKLHRHIEVKRIQHHQTSLATNTKGTHIAIKLKRKKDLQKQIQNNQADANWNICIKNYLKCKWIQCTNQKIQTDWMYKKQDTYMLPIGDSLQT